MSNNLYYITLKDNHNNSIESTKYNIDEIIKKFNESDQKLVNSLKPYIDQQKKTYESISRIIVNNQDSIKKMIEPLKEVSSKLVEMYEPIINYTIENLTKIFEEIDFSTFDIIYKEISIKCLLNGFYPYRKTKILYTDLFNTNNKSKICKIIKTGLKNDIIENKKILLQIYPSYKKEITEIYNLYRSKKYRLCILSIINIVSIINNNQFEYIDFTEKDEIRKKLLKKRIMKNKETNYLLFSPYINDDDLKKSNILIKNYRNNPIKYPEISYNRNAILHGYSKKFGNEINCLRWFSVLFNTMEITEKLLEIEGDYNV